MKSSSPFESVEDSPFLRAELRSLDEGVDELRERTARLSKGCALYRDGLEDAYANEVNFAESVRAFHGPLDDAFGEQVGASQIDRLLGAFRDIADARGALLSAVETELCSRLEQIVAVDLRDLTEAKKRFERCSGEHERARVVFLKLTKDTRRDVLKQAENDLRNARREHDSARFGLMSRLHEADSKKRVAFKRCVASAVDAHRRFFEKGFKVLTEMEPFAREVIEQCDAYADAHAEDALRLLNAMAAHTAALESETGETRDADADAQTPTAAPQSSLTSDRSRAIQNAMHVAEARSRTNARRSFGNEEDRLDISGGTVAADGARPETTEPGPDSRDASLAAAASAAAASAAAAAAAAVAEPWRGSSSLGTSGSKPPSFTGSGHSTIASAGFLARGYLLKRSSSMRADWKRRFFVLDAFGHLGYYRDADVGQLFCGGSDGAGSAGGHSQTSHGATALSRAKDTVSLLTATIKPDLEDSPNLRFCFRVVSPGKTYCLQAESDADRARWMEAITAAVAGLLSNASAIKASVSSISSPPRAGSKSSSRAHSRAGSFSAAFFGSKSHGRAASFGDGLDSSFEIVSPPREGFGGSALGGVYGHDGDAFERRACDGELPAPYLRRAARDEIDPLEILRRVRSKPGNATCVDCGESDPEWASLNLGVVLCIECGGAHRRLGVHVSKVRSCVLDVRVWEPGVLEMFERWGNASANALWEAKLEEARLDDPVASSSPKRSAKPTPNASLSEKTAYAQAKWCERRWFATRPETDPDAEDADRALRDAVREGDVAGVMAAIAAGADVDGPSADAVSASGAAAADGADGGENRVRLVREASANGHEGVLEALLQNGASVNAVSGPDRATALHAAVRAGRDGVAKLLIRRGAAPEAKDGKGRTALDAAMDRGSIQDEELFLLLSGSSTTEGGV